MSAYLIVDTKISNPEVYEEYKKLAKPIVEKYGGVYRVRGVERWTLGKLSFGRPPEL